MVLHLFDLKRTKLCVLIGIYCLLGGDNHGKSKALQDNSNNYSIPKC